jgi:hypothetical protein
VPKHVKLYGFFYEINSGKLTEVVRDIPASARIVRQLVYRSKIGATKQGFGPQKLVEFLQSAKVDTKKGNSVGRSKD